MKGNNTEIYEQTCGICNESNCVGCAYYSQEAKRMDIIDWLRDIFDVTTDIQKYVPAYTYTFTSIAA